MTPYAYLQQTPYPVPMGRRHVCHDSEEEEPRRCPKCGEIKTSDKFYPHNDWCKTCKNKHSWEWRKAKKEKLCTE